MYSDDYLQPLVVFERMNEVDLLNWSNRCRKKEPGSKSSEPRSALTLFGLHLLTARTRFTFLPWSKPFTIPPYWILNTPRH